MNVFFKNSWIQKLIIVILVVLLFNFIYPHYSQASWYDGALISPIKQLVLFIGDGLLSIQQYAIMGNHEVIIQHNVDWKDKLAGVFMAIGAVAIVVAAGFCTGGVAWIVGIAGAAVLVAGMSMNQAALADNWDFPTAMYTLDAIFSNTIPAFDVNFVNPITSHASGLPSTAAELQKYISSTYNAIRTLSLVALLIVLVYVGIRIIIASTANDKSKYKIMFGNWVVAVCLVFLMHYIMAFGLTLVDKFNELLTDSVPMKYMTVNTEDEIETPSGEKTKEFSADFLGYIRFFANDNKEPDTLKSMLFILAYLILVIMTAIFTIMYLKRVIYMAFLTLVAPLVAVTYPIDKIKDGKSQAFDFWMKEYFFNLLMQPMHLLLYTILIKSVSGTLVYTNPLYTLVAIGFLLPAEKFFRKMFGMDKANSAGDAGSFAAGALAGQALSGLKSLAAPKKDKNKKDGDSDGGKDKIRTQDNPELDSGENQEENKDNDNDGVRTDDNDDYWGEEEENKDDKPDLDDALLGAGVAAAAAHQNSDDPVRDAERERLEEQLADGQLNENELTDEQKALLGKETSQQQAVREELNNKWNKEEEKKNKVPLGQRLGNKYDGTKFGKSKAGKFLKATGSGALKLSKSRPAKWVGRKFKGLPKAALRAYAGAILGGTAGLIGLAAGIADGKPGTAWKYTAAGLGAGYVGGAGLIDRGVSSATKRRNTWDQLTDEKNQEKFGTTDKNQIKQIKAQEKAQNRFRRENQTKFDILYGANNSQRYMDKAIEMQNQGLSEQQIYQQIDRRYEAYKYLNAMGSDMEARYGQNKSIEQYEDDYMQYMDAGVTNKDNIDKAMRIEKTGIYYDGVEGRMHKGITRDEGMAAALENQKIEDRYNEEKAAGGTRTKKEIGDAYLKDKRSKNIEKARENGMDKESAEAFANRSEAATQKLRSMK